MSEAKIEIKIGDLGFSGEGDQDWLSKQLDKILAKATDLTKLAPASQPRTQSNTQTQHQAANFSESTIVNQTLVKFLRSKNATTAQVDKFLATAIWVEAKDNKNRLTTSDVSSALRKSGQSKINNASDTLNQNVSKGFCEKDGKEFFVTQEGKDHMKV